MHTLDFLMETRLEEVVRFLSWLGVRRIGSQSRRMGEITEYEFTKAGTDHNCAE